MFKCRYLITSLNAIDHLHVYTTCCTSRNSAASSIVTNYKGIFLLLLLSLAVYDFPFKYVGSVTRVLVNGVAFRLQSYRQSMSGG